MRGALAGATAVAVHALCVLLLAAETLAAQDAPAAPGIATAVRASRPPAIDAHPDDEVWGSAPVIDGFRQTTPVEDGDPSFRTEAQFAYDADAIYVLIRAYDPHPDSIIARLNRRDTNSGTDLLRVSLDSYLDRRSAYNFLINPAGTVMDGLLSNDGATDDLSWDGVWEAVARVDSLGWIAEFRIPTSQLRFPPREEHVFGVQVARLVARRQERSTWPLERRSGVGRVSQFGELHGLRGLSAPRGVELLPYTVVKSQTEEIGALRSQPTSVAVGADIKYALTSNLTLDATVNPDFGQVEADPAILNLATAEAFLPERRPFFVEGSPLFRFDFGTGGNDQLFYSRRVARTPQLTGVYGGTGVPPASPLQAAAKLSGRLANGTSLGVLAARTGRLRGPQGRTVEPATTVAVGRLQHDWRRNQSMVGAAVSVVHRELDEWSRDYLRRDAVVAGVDTRQRWMAARMELTSSLALSHVAGDSGAILRTQRALTQNFQRPDADLGYDPSRRSLGGWMSNSVLRWNGVHFPWVLTYRRSTPGFEPNDAGFLPRADLQRLGVAWSARMLRPAGPFRLGTATLNASQSASTGDRLPLSNDVGTTFFGEFRNFWSAAVVLRAVNLGAAHDDRVARGGPAVRVSPVLRAEVNVDGDQRGSRLWGFYAQVEQRDEGRSGAEVMALRGEWRSQRAFEVSAVLEFERRRNDWQWYANEPGTGEARFARLSQRIVALTSRASWTLSPTLGLQVYAQPYVNVGHYSDPKRLAEPRAVAYADRLAPLAIAAPPGFSFAQFRSNTVLRWEFRPGSTLFAVWSQGRDVLRPFDGDWRFSDDVDALFGRMPSNTFLVKVAYWMGR